MKKRGYPVSEISLITGLSEAEIEKFVMLNQEQLPN